VLNVTNDLWPQATSSGMKLTRVITMLDDSDGVYTALKKFNIQP